MFAIVLRERNARVLPARRRGEIVAKSWSKADKLTSDPFGAHRLITHFDVLRCITMYYDVLRRNTTYCDV